MFFASTHGRGDFQVLNVSEIADSPHKDISVIQTPLFCSNKIPPLWKSIPNSKRTFLLWAYTAASFR